MTPTEMAQMRTAAQAERCHLLTQYRQAESEAMARRLADVRPYTLGRLAVLRAALAGVVASKECAALTDQ